MARVALATVGAVIGSQFGTDGSQMGWLLGSMVGSAFDPAQKSEGPRLNDLTFSGSTYGTVIPYVLANPRVSGQVIWASTKREIAHTESSGKGGGGQEYTSYTYEIDMLYLLSDNEIAGVSRIWSNGKLIWSGLGNTETLMASGSNKEWARMTSYGGGPTQLPDPVYEAAVGTANAPAYRGRGTVFIQSLQLGGSEQIPNLTFEISSNDSSGTVQLLSNFGNQTIIWEGGMVPESPNGYGETRYLIENQIGPAWTLRAFATQPITPANALTNRSTSSAITEPPLLGAYGNCLDVRGEYYAKTAYIPASTINILALEDFTIEMMFSPYEQSIYNSSTSTVLMWCSYGAGAAAGEFKIQNLYTGTGYGRAYQFIGGGFGVTANSLLHSQKAHTSWPNPVHIAITRKGGIGRMFIDGELAGTQTATTLRPLGNGGGDLCMVSYSRSAYLIPNDYGVGKYDNIMIVKGVALYDSDFIPPSNKYATSSTVDKTSNSFYTLKGSVDKLLALAMPNSSMYDTTALSSISMPVYSLVVNRVSNVRSTLEVLAKAYNFEAVISDKIYFRPRGTASVSTIPYNDLYSNNNSPLPIKHASDLELPSSIVVTYSNINNDHQRDSQYSTRITDIQTNTVNIELPIGLTPSSAKTITDTLLLDQSVSMTSTECSVQEKYSALEPSDVVIVIDNDSTSWRFRVIKKAYSLGLIKLYLVLDNLSIFTQSGITSSTTGQSVVYSLPNTSLHLLNTHLLDDSNNGPGHYAVVRGSSPEWESAAIYSSQSDSNYQKKTTVYTSGIFGNATTILGATTSPYIFDKLNTLTVNLGLGVSLSSTSESSLLNSTSTNVMLVGSEIIQFATATLVNEGIYTLSSLLRGRRGTESFISTHVAKETVCLLGYSGMEFIPIDYSMAGTSIYYKAASSGQNLSSISPKNIIPSNIHLKPLSPVDLRVNRINTDTVFTWKRRTRLSTRFTGALGINTPIGEDVEKYTVEFYSDATFTVIKRTYTDLSTPTVTYTSANQITDFGANQDTFYIRIYQISSVIGKGYPLQVTNERPEPVDIRWIKYGGYQAGQAVLYREGIGVSLYSRPLGSQILSYAQTQGASSGKLYVEFTYDSTGVEVYFGLYTDSTPLLSTAGGSSASPAIVVGAQHVRLNGTFHSYIYNNVSAIVKGEKIGMAIDCSTGKVWVMRNGVPQAGSNPATNTGGITAFSPNTKVYPTAIWNGGSVVSVLVRSDPSSVSYPIAGFTGFLV